MASKNRVQSHQDSATFPFRQSPTLPLLIVLVGAFLCYVYVPCFERQVRLFGTWLQFAGFLTVALRLTQTRIETGRVFILRRFVKWLKQHLGLAPRYDRVSIEAAGSTIAGGSARARGSVSPDSPLEARIAMLEEQVESLYVEVGSVGERLDQNTMEFSERLWNESVERQKSDSQIEERWRHSVAGGLHLDWLGLILFLGGTALGSASPEISSILGGEASCMPIKV